MKVLTKIVLITALIVPSLWAAKNWTPPKYKIYAQTLSEQIMANHPELISVTFHGVPPGAPAKTYTMYAGSYLDRIGNQDDPDDVMVIETGITIMDPRWHKTADPIKKYCMMVPLRDRNGENIGLLVLAYRNSDQWAKGDLGFLLAATALRDGLQKDIPSHEAMFQPVN
ncbi:MAG: hypothetical protein PHQ04_00830 [Opitutaceae bacterium]|nr:hypothetical protein [Opitutaceae bacterium]